jgi:hypothetical protein
VPPRYVEYGTADPAAFSSRMKASATPLNEASAASAVTGKSPEFVVPVSQPFPAESTATALAPSKPAPPKTVE